MAFIDYENAREYFSLVTAAMLQALKQLQIQAISTLDFKKIRNTRAG